MLSIITGIAGLIVGLILGMGLACNIILRRLEK